MKSLDTGISPVLTVRFPRDTVSLLAERVSPRERSEFIRDAVAIALGLQCCVFQGSPEHCTHARCPDCDGWADLRFTFCVNCGAEERPLP